MTTAQRIARLEALLARVNERKSAPRAPVMRAASPAAAPPTRATMDIAVQSPSGTSAPAPSATPRPTASESWATETPTNPPPAMPPLPSSMVTASRPPPAQALDELPDLEMGSEDEGDDERATPPPPAPSIAESAGGEFDLPSSIRPPPASVPPPGRGPIELDPLDDESLEIDRAPLASAMVPRIAEESEAEDLAPPPARGTENAPGGLEIAARAAVSAAAGVAAGVVAGVAAGVAAVSSVKSAADAVNAAQSSGASASARGATVPAAMEPERETIEQMPPPPPSAASGAGGAERVAVRALPEVPMAEVVPMAPPARAMSFKALLQRSMALVVK